MGRRPSKPRCWSAGVRIPGDGLTRRGFIRIVDRAGPEHCDDYRARDTRDDAVPDASRFDRYSSPAAPARQTRPIDAHRDRRGEAPGASIGVINERTRS
jgi:hypothetical protein